MPTRVTIDACESQFDTVIRVVTGNNVLTSALIGLNDDAEGDACSGSGGDQYASHLELDLQPGVGYN